jgi:hypothetical protein
MNKTQEKESRATSGVLEMTADILPPTLLREMTEARKTVIVRTGKQKPVTR